jgi:hypothetical protein
MITTLREFIMLCVTFPGKEYEMFEDMSSDKLRDQIYNLADPGSPEPFRSAMNNMGFTEY